MPGGEEASAARPISDSECSARSADTKEAEAVDLGYSTLFNHEGRRVRESELPRILARNADRVDATLRYEDGSRLNREMIQDMISACQQVSAGNAMPAALAKKYSLPAASSHHPSFRDTSMDAEPPGATPGGHRGPGASQAA